MDYQGNYFPEEHDERESKTYRTVKGIFKWTMYGLSFLVYAIIFFVIFSSCDSRIITRNYYGGYIENFDPAGETVYRLNTEEFMNYDGSVQLSDIDYSDKYGFLEVGVKLNAKKQLGGNKDERFEAVLTDNLGNTFTLAGVQRDTNLRYSFARFSFSGVALDLAQHENGEPSADYGRYLTLTIYRAGSRKHGAAGAGSRCRYGIRSGKRPGGRGRKRQCDVRRYSPRKQKRLKYINNKRTALELSFYYGKYQ